MAGDFDLLETLQWTPGRGFFLLERHLNRVAASARHFGYPCDRPGVHLALDRAVLSSTRPLRVRLTLSHDGKARIECVPFEAPRTPARLTLSGAPIDRTNVFLYHKTTNRQLYEDARPSHMEGVFDDVVLWNADRQVTESTIANIVVEIAGNKLTPPVECGLLPGTFRAQLLDDGAIEEGVITVDQLRAAQRVWLINSVREWWPAELPAT